MENPASDIVAPSILQPLAGGLNLLAGEADAGFCADGVCHLPGTAAPAEKAE